MGVLYAETWVFEPLDTRSSIGRHLIPAIIEKSNESKTDALSTEIKVERPEIVRNVHKSEALVSQSEREAF